MATIPGWPAMVNDTGDGESGTVEDVAFYTAMEAAIAAQLAGVTNPGISASTIIDEVKQARGSVATLDTRLDVALNDDGTLKTFPHPPTYIEGTGPSAATVRPMGTLSAQVGSAIGGTSFVTMFTATVPANTLSQSGAAGRRLRIYAWGTTAANANNKQLRFRVGSAPVTISFSGTPNNLVWDFDAEFILLTGTTGDLHGKLLFTGLVPNVIRGTGNFDPTSDQTVDVQGLGVAGTDVTCYGFVVEVR